VPEENFWTLLCKGRLTEADTSTIQLGASPSRLTNAHFHHPLHILVSDIAIFVLKMDIKLQLTNSPYFLQVGCPSRHPTNSVKALKANREKEGF